MRVSVLLFVVGCFNPSPPEGAPCATSVECPGAQVCDNGHCTLTPVGDGSIPDADLTCSCTTDGNLSCASGVTSCALGCVQPAGSGPARCTTMIPSNGIDAALTTAVSVPIQISGAALFNTGTGAITGSLTRAGGEGVGSNIGFVKVTTGNADLGVFVFDSLTVTGTGSIRFVGTRAVVFLVRTDATVDGTIDVGAGCLSSGATSKVCPGPGGGAGAASNATAGGAGHGGAGASDVNNNVGDSGGGGGGAFRAGAKGGNAGTVLGGAGGVGYIADDLEPLVGGSGGGGGGPGALVIGPSGGGGGGAIQISVLGFLTINGKIDAGGAGGEGGPAGAADAAGGAGGGAGGGILLEAPVLDINSSAAIAANGGGGGGAASASAGGAGQDGRIDATAAPGGASGGVSATAGGNGGARSTDALPGVDTGDNANGGGGGGGVGRIFLRGVMTNTGTVSPAPGTGPVRSN